MLAYSNTNILYIEASTVNRWKIREWPERQNVDNVSIDFKAVYDFDKTDALIQSIQNTENKHDIIILQECSVYFPGNLDKYKESIKNWISIIKDNNILPVIATTVPPAKSTSMVDKIKSAIKQYILFKPSQIDQVLEFNTWLRDFTMNNNIHLIDLEKELRINDEDRYMNPIYDSGDNIHINKSAYDKLDLYLKERLHQILQKQ